ncbi:type I methionyl aminopeptidase [Clostridiaceae bacterium M8S5]|nr:type I methionyl aminopeptidase [Clostridiaceae bacterium M8S5]
MHSINDYCWCGSKRSYKECHMEFDQRLKALKKRNIIVPSRKLIKNARQIQGIKKCGIVNSGLLDMVGKNIREGISTEWLNQLAYKYTISKGARPGVLNFEGYPKSICTSINNVVCHGIPSKKDILKSGDIINVDVTTELSGYYTDASRMYRIGEISKEAEKLVRVTRECLYKGIEVVKPWKSFIGDIGYEVQKHARANGFTVAREFGGHGVGLAVHEDPFVFHFGRKRTGMILVPGMVFTIEPILNSGGNRVCIDEKDKWTVRTKDGSLSAQWEHTLLVTEDGVEIISM